MLKTKKYSGILAKPIDLKEMPFGTNRDAFVDEEILKRCGALFVHYDIDAALPSEKMWRQLAIKLAYAHVAGFHIKTSKRKGAKRKWTLDECRALVAAIDAEKTTKGLLKVAIRKAMKQLKWSGSIASIQTRYHEAVLQIKRDEFVRNHPEGVLGALMDWDVMPGNKSSRKRTTKKPG
jgi:hypothetical protein